VKNQTVSCSRSTEPTIYLQQVLFLCPPTLQWFITCTHCSHKWHHTRWHQVDALGPPASCKDSELAEPKKKGWRNTSMVMLVMEFCWRKVWHLCCMYVFWSIFLQILKYEQAISHQWSNKIERVCFNQISPIYVTYVWMIYYRGTPNMIFYPPTHRGTRIWSLVPFRTPQPVKHPSLFAHRLTHSYQT